MVDSVARHQRPNQSEVHLTLGQIYYLPSRSKQILSICLFVCLAWLCQSDWPISACTKDLVNDSERMDMKMVPQ